MWVPFLRSFPGNEAHKLFSGAPKWGVLGGGQKVYVEKVSVLFPPLKHVKVVNPNVAKISQISFPGFRLCRTLRLIWPLINFSGPPAAKLVRAHT